MLGNLVIDVLIAALLVALWHLWMRRINRQKSLQVAAWLERSLTGQGVISGIRWTGASQFRLDLRLWNSGFRCAWLTVDLAPRERPLTWLMALWQRRSEVATFHADLDCAPGMNLHVRNHRWCGRTRRLEKPPVGPLQFQSLGPVMITTREDWQEAAVLDALLAARSTDFEQVSFRQRSPHLQVSGPLGLFKPGATEYNLFECIQELAHSASARKL